MLEPNPTEDQIEKVRQIANVASFGEVEIRVNNLNQSAWNETVNDIAEWAKVKNKHTRIEGDGVKIDKGDNRLDIRNQVRVRLGYEEVDKSGKIPDGMLLFFPSVAVKKQIVW